MIKSISYWSMPDGLANTCPVDQALKLALQAGFQTVELAVGTTGVLTTETDQATCEDYRSLATKAKTSFPTIAAGLSWDCSPTSPNADTRKQSIKLHQAALQRTAWLGAESMLYVPGAVMIPWNPSYGFVPYPKAYAWAKQAIQRLADTAEKLNVELCVENVWNGLFYSPLELADLIDSIGSKKVGIYFDAGNVLGYHQYPPHWIEHLGKRIRRVHIKDFKRSVGSMDGFCDLLEGDVPWKETIAALKKIKYNKTIVCEMIPPTDGLLKRTSKALDKILAM